MPQEKNLHPSRAPACNYANSSERQVGRHLRVKRLWGTLFKQGLVGSYFLGLIMKAYKGHVVMIQEVWTPV